MAWPAPKQAWHTLCPLIAGQRSQARQGRGQGTNEHPPPCVHGGCGVLIVSHASSRTAPGAFDS